MASTQEMRNELKKLYGGDKWPVKVDKMSDRQVFAVYKDILKGGKK